MSRVIFNICKIISIHGYVQPVQGVIIYLRTGDVATLE